MSEFSIQDPANFASVDINQLPLHSLTLGRNEVHLWQARLDDQLAVTLKPLLSEEETARANRFHFIKDRNDFIVARGLLRKLLAAYLGVAGSADLTFSYGDKGKPFLAENQRSSINFNLAHSHGMALYAFSHDRELGVDLEFVKDELADEEIADRFFSTTEVKALQRVPAELRRQAFFNCWTRKEAYIKARGEGLSMPLNDFDVSLAPGEPAALLRNHK
ncbi:MAG: 4'-phosphopantetheinyl transferase superfamily protein, partial [Acidobacteriota bacterium]|nr:4'-phosphopantetheinyl transferase superfamily protein [Acidobacteriota bacterium]